MTTPYSLFSALDAVDENINIINLQIALTGGNANLTAWLDYFEAQQAAIIADLPSFGGGTIGGSIAASQIAFGSGDDAIEGSAALTYADGTISTTGLNVNGQVFVEGDGIQLASATVGISAVADALIAFLSATPDNPYGVYVHVDHLTGTTCLLVSDTVFEHYWGMGSPTGGNFSTDYGYHLTYNGADVLVLGIDGSATFTGEVNVPAGVIPLLQSANAVASGAGAEAGTLLNAPTAGDPAIWAPMTFDGVAYMFPLWLAA